MSQSPAPPDAPRTNSPLVLVLVTIFAGSNMAMAPLMSLSTGGLWHVVLGLSILASVLAQGALLSVWLVFTTDRFWRRALGAGSAAVVLFGFWEIGVTLALAPELMQFGVQPNMLRQVGELVPFIALSLPLIGLAIQSPLWFFRAYLGWRLETPIDHAFNERSLAINDFLLGTAIYAFAIACARVAPPRELATSEFWPVWGVVFSSIAAASLLGIIPAAVFVFSSRTGWAGVLYALLYSQAAWLLTLLVTAIFDLDLRHRILALAAFKDFAELGTLFTIFGIILSLGLKALRDKGFVLQRKRSKG